ncbi:MAG: molecular chaperone HtpG, partial [Candidatus Gracilibacteria bacterium]|nr:molecular chaperone HtpG [Candidatus Gracilibacteria bacterium]
YLIKYIMKNKQYSFEAETERLLELLTHSIYSNKEIFLRELISDSSDAIDKARIKSLTDINYLGDNSKFEIKIDVDKEKGIIIIEDNGIGMTKDEVIKNIGTIAKSGTKDFIEKLKESREQNTLIGQFGVGFYSAFMIAEKVELETKSNDSETSTIWISQGKGTFELSEGTKISRGTIIKLIVKEDEKEFLEEWKIRELIKKYSNYVSIPIMMKEVESEENKDKERKYEQINKTKAIWNKNKSEIKDEEYSEFYSQISYDFQKPLTHIHINTEGMVSYKSILFVPNEKNMFGSNDDPSKEYGPKLFVQNILILEKAKDLLPVWLRFVSGVIETSDLPLNISREMLQSNSTLEKIKKGLTKKILERLKFELKENPTNYDKFLQNYGKILKEGIYYESELKQEIAGIVKYYSLLENKEIALDEYLEKCRDEKSFTSTNNISNIETKHCFDSTENSDKEKEENKKELKTIYYITAKSLAEAKANPYIDQFRNKNIDVLLLVDPIDEWIVGVLNEYNGNKLVSITSSNLEIMQENEETKKDLQEKSKEFKDLFELIKNTIGTDKLEEVKASLRLGENIGALTTKEGSLTPQMEKMMKSMGQQIPTQKRILELNPENEVIKTMLEEFKKDLKSLKLQDMIKYVYQQAILLEGGELEDYRGFINIVNKFIVNIKN